MLRGKRHHCLALQSASDKYGQESLKFSIIEECGAEMTFEREQFYIDTLQPKYNINLVAGGAMKGRRHTEATRQKMRDAKMGVGNPNFGKKFSDKTREKMRASQIRNRRFSDQDCMQVFEMAKSGLKYSEIAESLKISAATVYKYVKRAKSLTINDLSV